MRPTSVKPQTSGLAQERLWLAERIDDRIHHHIPSMWRLRGPIAIDALRSALDALVVRHEPLRTTIRLDESGPLQTVEPARPVPFVVHDVCAHDPELRVGVARRLLAEDARRPFDLTRDVMIRAALVTLSDDDHFLCLTLHHVAADAWSVGIVWRELLDLYQSFATGAPPRLTELPVRYRDWVRFERNHVVPAPLMDSWRKRLDGLPLLDLPTDRAYPPAPSHHGAAERFALSEHQRDALMQLGGGGGATLFVCLLAAWTALLHRLTGATDFAVGGVHAGRSVRETEHLVGLFADNLVLRTSTDGDPSFRELLARARATVLETYGQPSVPFQRLVEELNPPRDLGHSPFFQTMVVQVPTREPIRAHGIIATQDEILMDTSPFDMTLYFADSGNEVTGRLEYATELFDRQTARRVLGYLGTLIDGATNEPDRPLSTLTLLPPAEHQRIVVDWNNTSSGYPQRPIHDLFAQWSARCPSAVALIEGDRRCTFAELDMRANQIAHALRNNGIHRSQIVGVFARRSIEATTAILGVLKAGAAFLPLDTGYPQERIAAMLTDSGAQCVLTTAALAAQLPRSDADVICLDAIVDRATPETSTDIESGAEIDDIAYVIYTSGSTGTPKGVAGVHRGTVNRLSWMQRVYPFEQGEIACQKTALGFVDSIAEMLGPLLAGVPTVIIDDHTRADPWALVTALADARVTRIVLVPSLLRALLDVGQLRVRLPYLTAWVTSGEPLTSALAQRFAVEMPQARLINFYGSSEVSADATCYEVPPDVSDLRTIPIGRPIDNTSVYILDRRLHPVPVGVAGEIYIGGDGLARGYLHSAAMNADRFVPNPFAADCRRLFRTGDIGRFRADGQIEYLGRNDGQVKVRGVRVEITEVEATLETHPQIRAAAVVSTVGEPSAGLVAYIVPAGPPPTVSELRAHAARTLLPQMIPAHFVTVPALPTTPSGKLDRLLLARSAPDGTRLHDVPPGDPPANVIETTLIAIWAKLLKRAHVDVHDDFFELGGHSLLAVKLFEQIREVFGVTLPVTRLFYVATIAQLARAVHDGPTSPPGPALVTLESAGDLPPLFLLPGIGNELVTFVHLGRRLAPGRPVHGLVDRSDDRSRTIDELADDFVELIRGAHPDGPYHLGGHSSGASIAIEIARRLTAAGAVVGVVAVLDHANPSSGYLSTPPWRPSRYMPLLLNLIRWLREPAGHDVGYLARAVPRKIRYLAKAATLRVARRLGVAAAPSLRVADFLDATGYNESDWERMEFALAARVGYSHRPFEGELTVFKARLRPVVCSFAPDLGWSDVALGGLDIRTVPGHHNSYLHEPQVGALAEQLRECLDRAERRATPTR